MSEFIERCAKAAFNRMRQRAADQGIMLPGDWEDESEELRHDWRETTRATLTEMRGAVTEEMLSAGTGAATAVPSEDGLIRESEVRAAWQAAIDTALKEGQ